MKDTNIKIDMLQRELANTKKYVSELKRGMEKEIGEIYDTIFYHIYCNIAIFLIFLATAMLVTYLFVNNKSAIFSTVMLVIIAECVIGFLVAVRCIRIVKKKAERRDMASTVPWLHEINSCDREKEEKFE